MINNNTIYGYNPSITTVSSFDKRICDEQYIFDNAKYILQQALNTTNPEELATIFYTTFFKHLLTPEKEKEYDTLLKMNNKNYLELFRILINK